MQDKVAGSSYVIGLYRDLEWLNETVPAYKVLILRIDPEISERQEKIQMIEDQDLKSLREMAERIVYSLITTRTKLKSLGHFYPYFKDFCEKSEKQYNDLINQRFPVFEQLNEYMDDFNLTFVKAIPEEFLTKVSSSYEKFMEDKQSPGYGDSNEETREG